MITQICATENKLAATVLCYKIPSVQIQMKRLKFPLSIATSVAFLLFILSGCSKNEPEILSVDKSAKVSIKEIKQVDDKFANFESFLKSESFQILKTNIGDFKIESIQAVSFYDESISGFIIIINDAKGYKRDLMTVYGSG